MQPCDIYVADCFANNNGTFNYVSVIPGGHGTPISIGSGFSCPKGVAVNTETGDVFVTEYFTGNLKLIPRGSGTPIAIASGFSNTGFIFLNGATGDLFLADAIKVLRNGTNVPITIGSGFRSPQGVSVNTANGDVFVADTGNNAVKRLPGGSGSPVSVGSGFSFPIGVSVNSATGDVFVVDNGNGVIKKIPGGSGNPIIIGSGFSNPYGIFVDSSSSGADVFVANNGDYNIKVIPGGTGSPVIVATGFNSQGIFVNTQGCSLWSTPTPSASASVLAALPPSATCTESSTLSPSSTLSATRTTSGTESALVTPSASFSLVATPTMQVISSSSVLPTQSQTRSTTPSGIGSFSSTLSATSSFSATAAATPTSPSASFSVTLSSTGSSSISPSASPSATKLPSPSSAATETVSTSATSTVSSSRTPAPSPTSTPMPQAILASLPPPSGTDPGTEPFPSPPSGYDAILGDSLPPRSVIVAPSSLTIPISNAAKFASFGVSFWGVAVSIQQSTTAASALPILVDVTCAIVAAQVVVSSSSEITLSMPQMPLRDGSLRLVGLLNPNNGDTSQFRSYTIKFALIAVPASFDSASSLASTSYLASLGSSASSALVSSYGLHVPANAATLGLYTPVAAGSLSILHISSLSWPFFSDIIVDVQQATNSTGPRQVRSAWSLLASSFSAVPPDSGSDALRQRAFAAASALGSSASVLSLATAPPPCPAGGAASSASSFQVQFQGRSNMTLIGGIAGSALGTSGPFFTINTTVTIGGLPCPMTWLAPDGSMATFLTPPISSDCVQQQVEAALRALNGGAPSLSPSVSATNTQQLGLCGYVPLVVTSGGLSAYDLLSSPPQPADASSSSKSAVPISTSLSCPPVCPPPPSIAGAGICESQRTLAIVGGSFPNFTALSWGAWNGPPGYMSSSGGSGGGSPIYYSPSCGGDFTDPSAGACAVASSAAATGVKCGFISLETGTCSVCPAGAICPGGVRVWPQLGLWVSNEYSQAPISCAPPAEQRCVGWNTTTGRTQCGPTYRQGSSQCSVCASGCYLTAGGSCEYCPSALTTLDRVRPALSVLGALLCIFIVVAILVLTVQRIYVKGTLAGGLTRSFEFLLALFEVLRLIAVMGRNASPNLPSFILSYYTQLRVVLFEGFTLPPACTIGSGDPLAAPKQSSAAGCVFAVLLILLLSFQWFWWKPWKSSLNTTAIGSSNKEEGGGATINSPSGGVSDASNADLCGIRRLCADTCGFNISSESFSPRKVLGVFTQVLLVVASLAYPTLTQSAQELLGCSPSTITASDYVAFNGDGSTLISAGFNFSRILDINARQLLGAFVADSEYSYVSTRVLVTTLRAYPTVICGETLQSSAATLSRASLVLFSFGLPLFTLVALWGILWDERRGLGLFGLSAGGQQSAAGKKLASAAIGNDLDGAGSVEGSAPSKKVALPPIDALVSVPPPRCCFRRCCCCSTPWCDARCGPYFVLCDPRFDGARRLKSAESLSFFFNGHYRMSHFYHRHLDWAALFALSYISFGANSVDQTRLSSILGVLFGSLALPLVTLILLASTNAMQAQVAWVGRFRAANTVVFAIGLSMNAMQSYADAVKTTTGVSPLGLSPSFLNGFAIFTFVALMSLFVVVLVVFVHALLLDAASEQRAQRKAELLAAANSRKKQALQSRIADDRDATFDNPLGVVVVPTSPAAAGEAHETLFHAPISASPAPAAAVSAAPLLNMYATVRHAGKPAWKREAAEVKRTQQAKQAAAQQQIAELVAAGDTAAVFSAAAAFEAQDDLSYALQLLQASLAVLEKTLGDVNPETLRVMTRVAVLLSAMGEYEEVASMSARVAFAYKVTLGKGAPETLGAVMDQAHALMALERPDRALKFFKQALVGYRALYGDLHPTTIACLRETAVALLQDGRVEDAAGLEAEAEALRAKALAARGAEIHGLDAFSSSDEGGRSLSAVGAAIFGGGEKAAPATAGDMPAAAPSDLSRARPELAKSHHNHQQRAEALQVLRLREASRSQKKTIGLQRKASRRAFAASGVANNVALGFGGLTAGGNRDVDLGGEVEEEAVDL